ncbi:dihydrofolate reductase family protein [Vibrio vulnificus]|uniref:dihydrofolate reductase family protein n=1 Tax=Vibrio vulnificus TaxID=672 RepID=UPI0005F206BE|nr:dihydrofolate reductase family protein [Vibrio vulnificus]EGQ8021279.1 dihydrofolate reductase [Vibrio vulnificus]EGR8988998.1 dihydrofolate reductase [Vibrio vulnificus]EGS1995521.1 dihydrofolate reductase [Vibrio vulnificus]EHD1696706.1 dihydrofolate reductase [Vibrio vulnificus]EHU4974290.1 dihydrofolate reductase [Vibrio vulnificus]
MSNIVYIATSLDGYIAGPNNDMDWLHQVPNPDGSDFGFADFMANIDALVMGRNTFEMVLSFGVEWPYNKPVFVLSNTLKSVPEGYQDKVFLVQGALPTVVEQLHQQGYQRLYIDGGKTVQSFLAEDLIDEMIITTIPVLLGAGIPLFGSLPKTLNFKHIHAQRLADYMVKNHYVRVR